jgi:two-component system response regulator AtoC
LIVGRSQAMRDLLQMVGRVADSQATILIEGESGTGKGLIAREIHRRSRRRERPFVAVNCAALAETLLESELFGHVKGAFTGALFNKKGLFEEADGGTLFLDEIAETSLAFQAKLLRAIEDHEIRPVGASRTVKVNVRLIAATNRQLREAVQEHIFRQDLAYRLAVVPIVIPPLRERREDIPEMVEHFVAKVCRQNGLPLKRVPPDAMQRLLNHTWPGNVRELENLVERAVLLSPGDELDPLFFAPPDAGAPRSESLRQAAIAAVETVEKEHILWAVRQCAGNRAQAARLLSISRATLYKRLKRYGLFNESGPAAGGWPRPGATGGR